jgi:hypothetical protein
LRRLRACPKRTSSAAFGRLSALLELPAPASVDPQAAEQIRARISKGASGFAVGFATDDCRKTYEDFVAKGVEVTQEPVERDYGIDIGVRDPFGNHIRVVQFKAG